MSRNMEIVKAGVIKKAKALLAMNRKVGYQTMGIYNSF